MSQEFMDRAERLPASTDGDTATAQVIARMCAHIEESAGDPAFQKFARSAVRQFKGGPHFAATGADPLSDPQAIAESAWWWAKSNLKFVHHSKLLSWWLGIRDGYQLLIAPNVILRSLQSPDVTIRDRGRKGDCAIYSMMIAAMLQACGVPYELVTVAVDPSDPAVYSHVFVYAVLPDGRRLPVDASHGAYPGWSVPMAHRSRTQVWNSAGLPVSDRASRFTGLHQYMRTRGLGDCITQYNADGSPYQACMDSGGGGGFNWGSLIGNLANQWTQIGGRVIAPTTTYSVGPNGAVSYSTPGSAAPPLGLPSLGAGSGSLLLYGGLGLVALLVVTSMVKK